MGSDIRNVQAQVLSLASKEIPDAIKATSAQLETWKKDNGSNCQNVLNAIEEKAKQQLNLQTLKENGKRLQEKMREEKQLQKRYASERKMIKTYSDIIDEDAISSSVVVPDSYNQPVNVTPVQFNDLTYIYNFPDSNTIKSAIIVVKHNPANDSSHTKHITVEITGNNGAHKTLEFTVEVYQ